MHRRAVTRFSVESFLSENTEELRRQNSSVFMLISGIEKCYRKKRNFTTSCRVFLSHRTEKTRGNLFLCSRKFRVSRKFRDKRGRITKFSRKYFVSQDRKIPWGTSFVIEIFCYPKIFWIPGGKRMDVVSWFPVVKLWSHTTEKHRKEPFGVSKSFGYRKILCKGGLCHDFLSKVLWLRVPKNFVEKLFCVSENIWYRKLLQLRENFYDFPSNFFVLQDRKNS